MDFGNGLEELQKGRKKRLRTLYFYRESAILRKGIAKLSLRRQIHFLEPAA